MTRRRNDNRNLTWNITHDLGVAIVAGEYSAGAPFPTEAQLCQQFGVSRSILREAIKMLTAKGMLSSRPRQGITIEKEDNWNLLDSDVLSWLLERKFSLQLIREFSETRRAFEPEAAFLAASSGSAEDIAAIENALHRMENAKHGDDDPLESDIAFHVAVLKASDNRFFMQLHDLTDSALRYSIRLTNQFKGVELASINDHKAVYQAIRDKQPETARQLMVAMINEVLELIKQAQIKMDKKLASSN
ncbi:FadR/GntR family transcriptional regulator [Emcibacter sp.]|uniref:FadR/GntR family transcriptional regulator n=1 Tax=Emcibacter sp. TaxID=1979954 RepID=UPI003A8DE0E8